MPEATIAPATPTTTTAAPATTVTPALTAIETPAPVVAPTTKPVPATNTGLEFLPEAYRNDPSFSRYKNAEEFAKGFKNLEQFVGKKEVVQGIQVPGDDATPEQVNEFYSKLGRPEAADKYTLPEDIALPEGFDLGAEKSLISNIAFELGLSNKQASSLMKLYAEKTSENFKQSQEQVAKDFYAAAEQAFGKDSRANIDLAKKGAKALGGADKLTLEDVSNPLLLKALAMLGKDVGEDTLEKGTSETQESILQEAKRLQMSQEYKSGDPQTVAKVQEMYKKAYPV